MIKKIQVVLENHARIWYLVLLAGMVSFTNAFGQQIRFFDGGQETNTYVGRNAHGAGFFDVNNDGWADIFLVHNITETQDYKVPDMPHVLLMGSSSLVFTDIAVSAGVGGNNTSAQGLAAADINNNGYVDIAVGMGRWSVALYQNRGDNTFTDITNQAGVGNYNRGRTLVFCDFDNDGFVDLFLFGDSDVEDVYPIPIILYRNNGNNTFSPVNNTGLNAYRHSDDLWGVAFADINNNGYMDFFIPNFREKSRLYRNNGDGTFTDITIAAGISQVEDYEDWPGAGAVFLDYNNNGLWDLFVRRRGGFNQLYRNNGDGTFTDVAVQANLRTARDWEPVPYGGGLTVADFNNNGYVDILSLSRFANTNRLYQNNGDGTFTSVNISHAGLSYQHRNWTAPVADYNHNGYPDVYLAISFNDQLEGHARLLENAGGSHNWLHVNLQGVQSNRLGIGARLVAHAGNLKMMRHILGGAGYKVDSFTSMFGLNNHTKVDSLIVYWPSGIVQKAVNIDSNQLINLTEREGVEDYMDIYIRGAVTYYTDSQPVNNVRINVSGELNMQTTTDGFGRYHFLDFDKKLTFQVMPSKPHGENAGSALSSFDAALTARHAVGLELLEGHQLIAADVNQDGSVNMLDAVSIARAVVGLHSVHSSQAGAWLFMPENREYTSFSAALDSENYSAYILGDVTGGWAPSGKIQGKTQNYFSEQNTDGFIENDTLFIPVSVDMDEGVLSADFWLEYNKTRLGVPVVCLADELSEFQVIINTDLENQLRIALFGTEPVYTSGELVVLKFSVSDHSDSEYYFNWTRFQINNHNEMRGGWTVSTSVDHTDYLPPFEFDLNGNYPNPFNPGTIIKYQINEGSNVTLNIFDIKGRLIRTLVNTSQTAGAYQMEWDGKDQNGLVMPSGIYICRLQAGQHTASLKLLKAK